MAWLIAYGILNGIMLIGMLVISIVAEGAPDLDEILTDYLKIKSKWKKIVISILFYIFFLPAQIAYLIIAFFIAIITVIYLLILIAKSKGELSE